MDIKGLLGDAYREGMTIEEINAALADKEFVDPTTLPKSVSKELFDKKVSELAKFKKDYEDLKNTTLTDEEQRQKVLEDAENARKDYLRKSARLDVEKVFVEGGLTHDDYKDIIEDIVSEDAEKSVTLAKTLMSVISNQKTATEKAVKSELLKGSPKPPAGKGSEGMTLDKFRKLSTSERAEFYTQHPEEYKKLYDGGNE